VAEIFSSWFGPCQVIAPTIGNIMMKIDDAENKIHWLVLNLAKLEEDQKIAMQVCMRYM
jgi:hypothetical protein